MRRALARENQGPGRTHEFAFMVQWWEKRRGGTGGRSGDLEGHLLELRELVRAQLDARAVVADERDAAVRELVERRAAALGAAVEDDLAAGLGGGEGGGGNDRRGRGGAHHDVGLVAQSVADVAPFAAQR